MPMLFYTVVIFRRCRPQRRRTQAGSSLPGAQMMARTHTVGKPGGLCVTVPLYNPRFPPLSAVAEVPLVPQIVAVRTCADRPRERALKSQKPVRDGHRTFDEDFLDG